MRVLFNHALFAAAGLLALAAAAFQPAQAAAPNGNDNQARYARMGVFDLDLPVQVPGLTFGPEDSSLYVLGEIGNDFVLFNGVSIYTGLNVDVARALDNYVPNAFDGLFHSSPAVYSPYLSLSSGGSYFGGQIALAQGLQLNIGQAFSRPGRNVYLMDPLKSVAALGGAGVPYDARRTSALLAGLSWNFSKWSGLDLTASRTLEHGGALGTADTVIDTAKTSALGLSARVGFGGGWVTTVSYGEATTQLRLNPGAFVGAESSLRSQSYGIAVAKRGLFGHDALGLAFSRPATGYSANALPSDMQFQFFGRDKLFAGKVPETDIELGYITSFLDGPVALQANASYQMNYNGQDGNNSLSLVSKAKIKF